MHWRTYWLTTVERREQHGRPPQYRNGRDFGQHSEGAPGWSGGMYFRAELAESSMTAANHVAARSRQPALSSWMGMAVPGVRLRKRHTKKA
jgi:hypothetical protein